MLIEVTSGAMTAMQQAAASALPNEACGILLGKNNRITGAIETRNVHPSPATHFEIDPQALIDAYRVERGGGPEVLGYFHSHPNGRAEPSDIDQASAAGDGKLWAIIAADRVNFWLDEPEGFRLLSYAIASE